MQKIRTEISKEVDLCDSKGRLNRDAVGWSIKPFHRCNLTGHTFRKKMWDYWCVMGDRFLFSATISHIDYAAAAFIYIFEYDTGRYVEQTVVRPLPGSKKFPMNSSVYEKLEYQHGGLEIEFEQKGSVLEISVKSDSFDGKPLVADIKVERPPDSESINVVVPWSSNKFQYTSKQPALPSSGTIQWGEEKLEFDPKNTFSTLDYGRGVWPFQTSWNWASFSARVGEDLLGVNMGARWTDGTGMNENGICLNGRAYKIFDEILFKYNEKDFMQPWELRTEESDEVVLTFQPFYERVAKSNLLFLKTEVHQMFGYYYGQIKADGRVIKVDKIPGWAEEHYARW